MGHFSRSWWRRRQRARRQPDKARWLRHRGAFCTQRLVGTRIGEASHSGPATVKTAKNSKPFTSKRTHTATFTLALFPHPLPLPSTFSKEPTRPSHLSLVPRSPARCTSKTKWRASCPRCHPTFNNPFSSSSNGSCIPTHQTSPHVSRSGPTSRRPSRKPGPAAFWLSPQSWSSAKNLKASRTALAPQTTCEDSANSGWKGLEGEPCGRSHVALKTHTRT